MANDKTIKQLTALRDAGVNPLVKKAAASEAKYIPKDQRLFENLKVPGYETPEKSAKSYKHHLQDRVDDKVTGEDWRNDTPTYRKFLADLIADDQTNIRWDSAGGWRDKWGDPKTAQDALKEQQKIQKTYDEIYPPSIQKKYAESKLTPIQRKRNEFEKGKKEKRIASHLKQQWGLNKKPVTAKLKSNIPPPEIKKEDTPTYSSTAIMNELNKLDELAEIKLRDKIQTKQFEEIMKSKKDPDEFKGIASVPGNEKFKKVADTFNEYQKTIPRGVGTIIGEFD